MYHNPRISPVFRFTSMDGHTLAHKHQWVVPTLRDHVFALWPPHPHPHPPTAATSLFYQVFSLGSCDSLLVMDPSQWMTTLLIQLLYALFKCNPLLTHYMGQATYKFFFIIINEHNCVTCIYKRLRFDDTKERIRGFSPGNILHRIYTHIVF